MKTKGDLRQKETVLKSLWILLKTFVGKTEEPSYLPDRFIAAFFFFLTDVM